MNANTFATIIAVLVCTAVILTFAFLPEDKVIMEKLRRFYNENPNIDVPSPLSIKIAVGVVIVLIVVLCMVKVKEEKDDDGERDENKR